MSLRTWRFCLPLLIVLSGLTMASPAHAVSKLSGTDIDIYYDESDWGAATLTGNAVQFQTALDFYSSPGTSTATVFGGSLLVVAHAGYALTGAVTLGLSGDYSFPGALNWPYRDDGTAGIYSTVQFFDAGSVNPETGQHDYLGWATAGVSTPQPQLQSIGSFAFVTVANQAFGEYGSLGVSTIQILSASPKTASVSITSASYDFAVTAVSAVPEAPATAMLAAGLLTLALVLWRRRVTL